MRGFFRRIRVKVNRQKYVERIYTVVEVEYFSRVVLGERHQPFLTANKLHFT